jgi:hypothetical protein
MKASALSSAMLLLWRSRLLALVADKNDFRPDTRIPGPDSNGHFHRVKIGATPLVSGDW